MRSSSGGSPRTRVTTRVGRGGRGQSELVAVTLLVVVVVLGSIVVALTGVQALDDNKSTVAVSQAETSLQQLDSRASDVTLGFDGDTSQVAELQRGGGSGGYETDREAWMRVTIEDTETGNVIANGTVVNETMGSVVYRHDDTTLALEGGGVWRSDGGGAVMVSPPEFHFRDGTLTLPVVDISGDPSLSGPVRVTRAGVPERKFPNESANLTNRLRDGKVVVTVHSDYYRAWGQFFEDTSNAYVWYDDGKQQANAVFLVLPGWGSLRSGIIATSGAGELSLVGTGAYVDSYNSSIGDYDSTHSKNGTVEASGDVLMSGDARIDGNVRSGDVVDVGTSNTIDGNVSWTNGFTNHGTVTGTVTQIDGIASVEPVDGFVELSVDILQATNDNAATGYIVNDQLDIPGTSAELGAGAYYLENVTLEGKDLTLNTTNGDIYIGVRDWVNVEKSGSAGANVDVVGGGVVRIFLLNKATTKVSVPGEGQQNVNLNVGDKSTVYVPGDRSPQLRLYATQELKATVAGSNSNPANFTGIIYAPAGVTGPSSVYTKNSHVHGQILTGNLTLGQNGAVHYDLALQGTPLPRSPTLDRLEFMHVAVHRAEVRDR